MAKFAVGSRAVLLAACALLQPVYTAVAADANQQFEKIYSSEWQWRQNQSSVDEDSDLAAVPSSLPDVSLKTQQAHLKYWQNVEQQLDKLDSSQLSAANKINLAVYKEQIGSLMSDVLNKVYERPLSGDTSFWGI
ncbi:hypothetical protein KHX94_06780 [Shewanella dokdonensis]|uniref:Uncharacterized protein n=1 Tax=Shewanella dokdonensis TaxID=712036 RepID=A0ABX8DIA7_9GAMM|nr:hypothetical protein [Shewanella dokdonensis]QVK24249.1 hypothetical protein KHX94_06780 [Shewanella dokdonensis]